LLVPDSTIGAHFSGKSGPDKQDILDMALSAGGHQISGSDGKIQESNRLIPRAIVVTSDHPEAVVGLEEDHL
jgi:hypothetical protein